MTLLFPPEMAALYTVSTWLYFFAFFQILKLIGQGLKGYWKAKHIAEERQKEIEEVAREVAEGRITIAGAADKIKEMVRRWV